MARATKRRTLADKLKAETITLKAENKQLRNAARQLLAGLTEYAAEKNWLKHEYVADVAGSCDCCEWIGDGGDGDGPKIARHYLGLDQEGN